MEKLENKIYFEIAEFNRTGVKLTSEIEHKIQRHIDEISIIREKIGFPIFVSNNSGYRPRAYEVSKGRSGNGEHNYEGRGAADYTCATPDKVKLLVEELKKSSKYTRICYYPNHNFVHCDYKTIDRQYFECQNPKEEWCFKCAIK